MNFDQLRVFLHVAETGSLVKASLMLDRVQSAVSRQIAVLERDCGGRLFHRTGRGVVLTDLGEQILPHARAILVQAETMMQLASQVKQEVTGVVRIGAIPSLGSTVLARLFSRLRETHPGIFLNACEASSGQLESWINEGRVDMALLLRSGASHSPHDRQIDQWDTYLIGPVGDEHTCGPEIPFADLAGLPLLLPPSPNGIRPQVDEAARRRGVRLNIIGELSSGASYGDILHAGTAYILAPAATTLSMIGQMVRRGELQAARIVQPNFTRFLTMSVPQAPRSCAAVIVIDQILEIVKTMQRFETATSGPTLALAS